MRNNRILFIVILVLLTNTTTCFAASGSTDFIVDQLYTQWSSDIVHIVPVGPHTIVNPQNCPANGQYALDSASPGHKERVSLILAALLNNRAASVIVEGCSSDQRPKVISVTLKR